MCDADAGCSAINYSERLYPRCRDLHFANAAGKTPLDLCLCPVLKSAILEVNEAEGEGGGEREREREGEGGRGREGERERERERERKGEGRRGREGERERERER